MLLESVRSCWLHVAKSQLASAVRARQIRCGLRHARSNRDNVGRKIPGVFHA
jgi:hypothetical protein